MTNGPKSAKRSSRLRWLLAIALILGVGALLFGRSIHRQILQYAVLHAEGTDEETFKELVDNAKDPAPLLWRLWRTRKIPQRLLVLEHLKLAASTNPELCRQMRPLLIEAALDPDLDARESAFGSLNILKDSQLQDLARLQLRDADPQVRLLGLHYMRQIGSSKLVPEVIGVLKDPEPVVAASAESMLRTWTSNDFGFRIRMAMDTSTNHSISKLEPAKAAALKEAVNKWQDWWQTNQSNYPAIAAISPVIPVQTQGLLAGDFVLEDLAGHRVRLSDYKGKTVLLNFWATWCTACLMETPDLIELQKRHSGDVVLLAVCLDGRPVRDDDGDADESRAQSAEPLGSKAAIHKKVERTVKSLGINYKVLLNSNGEIGARFNGGELPTNVILSPDGQIRRRFVGTRSVAALDSMLEEAAHPGSVRN